MDNQPSSELGVTPQQNTESNNPVKPPEIPILSSEEFEQAQAMRSAIQEVEHPQPSYTPISTETEDEEPIDFSDSFTVPPAPEYQEEQVKQEKKSGWKKFRKVLSKIPIVGWLFREKKQKQEKMQHDSPIENLEETTETQQAA